MDYKLFDKNEKIPEKSTVVLSTFEKIKDELNKLKDEIKSEKILQISDEEIKSFRRKFKEVYQKYDNAKKVESNLDTKEQKNVLEKRPIDLRVIILNIDIQTLISRITNKIQREEARRIKEKYKIETLTFKENILTISSLVFTAFTLIQLNFIAFQNSNSYSVLDRIILFSGINIFAILGIFAIFCMIKSLISKEEENTLKAFKKIFKKTELIVIISVILILFTIFGIALKEKSIQEKNDNLENFNKLKKIEEKIELYEERIYVLEKNIEKLEETSLKNKEYLDLKFQKERIKTEEEILNIEKKIINLKK